MLDFLTTAATQIWTRKYPTDPNFKNYIRTILKRISPNMSNNVIYIALYYMNKLSMLCVQQKEPMSEYRVLVVAMMLADIHTSDNPYSLSSWKILSGFKTSELIAMRREFLQFLEYDLNIQPLTFKIWLLELQQIVQFGVNCALPLLPNYHFLDNSIQTQWNAPQYQKIEYMLDAGLSSDTNF
jgi:hypothetical protein